MRSGAFYSRRPEHDHSWGQHPTVKAARTLAIDQTLDAFRSGKHRLPHDPAVLAYGQYADHVTSLIRVDEPDTPAGRPVYRNTTPDDLAHCEVYVTLLAELFGKHGGWWI